MHRAVKPLAVIIIVLLAVALATGYLYTQTIDGCSAYCPWSGAVCPDHGHPYVLL